MGILSSEEDDKNEVEEDEEEIEENNKSEDSDDLKAVKKKIDDISTDLQQIQSKINVLETEREDVEESLSRLDERTSEISSDFYQFREEYESSLTSDSSEVENHDNSPNNSSGNSPNNSSDNSPNNNNLNSEVDDKDSQVKSEEIEDSKNINIYESGMIIDNTDYTEEILSVVKGYTGEPKMIIEKLHQRRYISDDVRFEIEKNMDHEPDRYYNISSYEDLIFNLNKIAIGKDI